MTSALSSPTSERELANISPEGVAPKKRLGTARAAQQLGKLLVDGNQVRSVKKARLRGAISGNPPYPPGKLKAQNQSWRTNVNFGGAEATVAAGVTPFDDLVNGSPYYAQITCDYGSAQERQDYAQIMTEQFDYVLRDWDGFDFGMQGMIQDMVAFAKGFLVWLDPTDWKFEWVEEFKVYVPERTKAYTGKVPMIMLRLNYEVHELWEKIENSSAKAAGWDVAACKRAIEEAYPPSSDGSTGGMPSYEIIQQRIKENELYEGVSSRVVEVFHFFVVEFDGKVTHQIVTETTLPNNGQTPTDPEPKFLFEAVSKYDSLQELIAPFFFECADGTWNGARGLAQKVFPMIEIQNRMFCSFIDNGFMRSGISLQATTAEAVQKLNLLQIGPFNIIPPGFTVQQSSIIGDLSGSIEVDRVLEQKLTEYTGTYKPKIDKPAGNPRTAEEVRLDYSRSATLSTPAVTRYYRNCDRFFKTLFDRVAKYSPEFKKLCIKKGIPKELFQKVIDSVCAVRAWRAVGNGNSYMRSSALKEMAPLVPMMPESGKVAWLRDSVAALTNRDAVDRYAPLPETEVPTEDNSIAMLENAAMKIGSPVIWTPTQNNVIHAQTHLMAGSQAAESLQKGGNPLEVMHFIDAIGQHVAEHLQHMANDPTRKNEFKMLEEQWKKLAGFADNLRAEITRKAHEAAAQQAQAPQNGQPPPEVQAQMQKTQADIAMKAAKNKQLMQQKDEKHRQQMAQNSEKFRQGLAINDAQTAADISRQHAEAAMKPEPTGA